MGQTGPKPQSMPLMMVYQSSQEHRQPKRLHIGSRRCMKDQGRHTQGAGYQVWCSRSLQRGFRRMANPPSVGPTTLWMDIHLVGCHQHPMACHVYLRESFWTPIHIPQGACVPHTIGCTHRVACVFHRVACVPHRVAYVPHTYSGIVLYQRHSRVGGCDALEPHPASTLAARRRGGVR